MNFKCSQANVSLVISVVNLAQTPSRYYASDSQAALADKLYSSLVMSFFSLSLIENALATGLIIFKILTMYREVHGLSVEGRFGCTNGHGIDIVPIISILIESGIITFVAQLVQILMFRYNELAYPIIAGLVIQLYVRGFLIVNF